MIYITSFIPGIDSASSTYSCLWCKCSSSERYDPRRKWSLLDSSDGARTIEENVELCSKRRQNYNVSHPPLFSFIPLKNVVIDNLHLFLRVADVLINLLITELKRQDSIEKVKTFNEFNAEKYCHLDSYQKFVSSLGIPGFNFYIGRDSKQMKCRTLTGPEKLKVFSRIKIAELLPTLCTRKTTAIQHLWNKLLELNQMFSKKEEELTPDLISSVESQARQWGTDFIAVYQTSRVTPYIHALMNHVAEFMQLHGSILPFTQHGLEKYNDVVTKTYFRCTNHRGEKEIMEKQNRMEHMQDLGVKTKKCLVLPAKLWNGHNRRTCASD